VRGHTARDVAQRVLLKRVEVAGLDVAHDHERIAVFGDRATRRGDDVRAAIEVACVIEAEVVAPFVADHPQARGALRVRQGEADVAESRPSALTAAGQPVEDVVLSRKGVGIEAGEARCRVASGLDLIEDRIEVCARRG
jgi:hypothetical protein